MFTLAKKDKVSTVIVRQIRDAIVQGKLQQDEALPNEKELTEQFGVSKHTMREALRTLETMGLITIRRGAGGGPVVSEIDMVTAREFFATFLHFHDISLHDLSDVRRLLEPYLAHAAANNLTPEAQAELCKIHEECEQLYAQEKNLVGAKAEIMFHVFLAKQTGNPLLWIILDFVNNILGETKMRLQPGKDFSAQVIKAHRKILKAILDNDAEAASKLMYDHICEVEQELS